MQQSLEQTQQQTLSAQQLQSLHILSMNTGELLNFINTEYTENPVLEITPPAEDATDSNTKDIATWFENSDYYIRDGIIQDEHSFNIPVIADFPLKEHLLSQLCSSTFPPTQWTLICYIIDCLDSSGFLTIPPEEICIFTYAPIEHVLQCIHLIQQLEPAGVGATDLYQALILQADRQGRSDSNLKTIIRKYLPQIALGQFHKISKELKISQNKIQDYVQYIKTLNPKPCGYFGHWKPQYIVPDIMFTCVNGIWDPVINDKWFGSIGISKLYCDYARNIACPEATAYIAQKIKRAHFILNCIEQRRATLLKLSHYTIIHQKDFLSGRGPLQAMNAKKAAENLGIHPSTISRSIRDKQIQTPLGIYPFKDFFQKNIHTKTTSTNSFTVSAEEIKQRISELIRFESKTHPLSDNMLTARFSQEGITISRRTIAKYREACGIKSSYERSS